MGTITSVVRRIKGLGEINGMGGLQGNGLGVGVGGDGLVWGGFGWSCRPTVLRERF